MTVLEYQIKGKYRGLTFEDITTTPGQKIANTVIMDEGPVDVVSATLWVLQKVL